jgi:DNA-binding transcriptional LysR family regulator
VRLLIYEHEPAEALMLLAADDIDLALTYDYNLAPAPVDRAVESTPLWSAAWSLGVHAQSAGASSGNGLSTFARFREHGWIVNSRNTADEEVVRTVASMAGYEPRIAHRADSLDLVQDMIIAGLGVALLPADHAVPPGIRLLPLTEPDITLRSFARTRRGHAGWPPLALVVDLLATAARSPAPAGTEPGCTVVRNVASTAEAGT